MTKNKRMEQRLDTLNNRDQSRLYLRVLGNLAQRFTDKECGASQPNSRNEVVTIEKLMRQAKIEVGTYPDCQSSLVGLSDFHSQQPEALLCLADRLIKQWIICDTTLAELTSIVDQISRTSGRIDGICQGEQSAPLLTRWRIHMKNAPLIDQLQEKLDGLQISAVDVARHVESALASISFGLRDSFVDRNPVVMFRHYDDFCLGGEGCIDWVGYLDWAKKYRVYLEDFFYGSRQARIAVPLRSKLRIDVIV